jgi:ATP-dependent DNA helicase RecQ
MAVPCGNCDTCITPAETWDATTASRKALSAILRTGQRFGTGHLVDLLLGVKSDKILRFGHDQLPTFGVGTELDRKGWSSLFRQLIVRGAIEVDHDSFGALRMTQTAEPILRGAEQVNFRRDRTATTSIAALKKKPERMALDPAASGLYEILRAERTRLAREQRVPAYVIFHDATLAAIATARPGTLSELGEIPGMGKTKIERYGAAVLAAVSSMVNPS